MFELWQKFRRCLGLPTEEMSAHFCPSLAAVKVGWLYFSTVLLAFHSFFSRFFFLLLFVFISSTGCGRGNKLIMRLFDTLRLWLWLVVC